MGATFTVMWVKERLGSASPVTFLEPLGSVQHCLKRNDTDNLQRLVLRRLGSGNKS